jgi:hypothetical protein
MFWNWKPILRIRFENSPLHNESSQSLTNVSIPSGQSLRIIMNELFTAICRFQVEFTYHEEGGSKILRKFVNICVNCNSVISQKIWKFMTIAARLSSPRCCVKFILFSLTLYRLSAHALSFLTWHVTQKDNSTAGAAILTSFKWLLKQVP